MSVMAGKWDKFTVLSNNGLYESKTRQCSPVKGAIGVMITTYDDGKTFIISDLSTGNKIQYDKAYQVLVNNEIVANAEWCGGGVKCDEHKLEFTTKRTIKGMAPVYVSKENGKWVITDLDDRSNVEYSKIVSVIYEEK